VSTEKANTPDEFAFLRTEVKRLRRALNQRMPGLAMLLRRRGFTIYKKEPADDLLLPAKKHLDEYYRMLHAYSFRLLLRDVIKRQDFFTLATVTKYATPLVTQHYLDYLLSIRLIKKNGTGFVLAKGPIRSFGETLEWYIAEVFKREFGAETVWGVKFRRPNVGGDYDVIARFGEALFYTEVKSSPPRQIYDSEIAAFLDRVEDLAPAVAVFLMDTELRMKDKLVPMFEKELRKRYKKPPKVVRMKRELFQIQDRIFIVNAKESIIRNIEKVASWYYQTDMIHSIESHPSRQTRRHSMGA
jgi:hypothetical protein